MRIFTNSDDTIIIGEKDNDNYIVKYDNEFYKIPKEKLCDICDPDSLRLKKEISDNPIVSLIMVATILFTILSFFRAETYVIIDSNFLIANVVLFGNVFIHEAGHIIFLKMYYKYGKVRIGFKFFFIYPAFYVDTSDSYFLPKYKRISVYLAGNFFNCIYVLICLIFFPDTNKFNYIIVSTILINFLPIIKSDGYYALISLWDKHNYYKGKKRAYFEDTIRGAIMFLLLFVLSRIDAFF